MPTTNTRTLASRLTAGCVTLVILLAAVAAGVGWWWKFRATTRDRAHRVPEAPAALAPAPSQRPTPGASPESAGSGR